jgi:hypothetical protein
VPNLFETAIAVSAGRPWACPGGGLRNIVTMAAAAVVALGSCPATERREAGGGRLSQTAATVIAVTIFSILSNWVRADAKKESTRRAAQGVIP